MILPRRSSDRDCVPPVEQAWVPCEKPDGRHTRSMEPVFSAEGLLMSGIEVIPSARRLIRSLRGMGYDFSQAVADVVDNSIAARATKVDIDIEFDGDNSWVRIADNGVGMKPSQLREALRYGSDRKYDDDDLGKFGLGLKTASLSQCECLSVASRWNTARADISGYSWDLAHIDTSDKWEIIPLGKSDINASHIDSLRDNPGTVVLWKRLDRLLGYKHPYGEVSRKRLMQMCREVEIHLAMVFHRFLVGEAGRRKFKIMVNGNAISPWDPFCRAESKTMRLQPVVLKIEHEGVHGEVTLEPFILPPQHAFSSKPAADAASGPANWNQQQGFYIYRAHRMIQSGGWSNLRSPDEHTKLARIAIHFSPVLDEAFKINVAKMRVQLPGAIRDAVREAVAPVVKLAREVYNRKPPSAHPPSPSPSSRSRGTTVIPSSTSPMLNGTEPQRNGMSVGPSTATAASDPAVLTVDQWSVRLLDAASDDERPTVERVLQRLRSTMK